MDLQKIKSFIEMAGVPDQVKKHYILREIATDKKAIPMILEMLEAERETQDELITDMNLELSRAFLYVEDIKIAPKQDFIKGEIHNFYLKWKDRIRCCFKMKGLP